MASIATGGPPESHFFFHHSSVFSSSLYVRLQVRQGEHTKCNNKTNRPMLSKSITRLWLGWLDWLGWLASCERIPVPISGSIPRRAKNLFHSVCSSLSLFIHSLSLSRFLIGIVYGCLIEADWFHNDTNIEYGFCRFDIWICRMQFSPAYRLNFWFVISFWLINHMTFVIHLCRSCDCVC